MKSNFFEPSILNLTSAERKSAWDQILIAIEDYNNEARNLKITTNNHRDSILQKLHSFNFDKSVTPQEALDYVLENLKENQMHFSNPGYMGLFVPRSTPMSAMADAIAGSFNCQLAAYRASPFAIEVENHLIKMMSGFFGYDKSSANGTFTSGGSEANYIALISSLTNKFPNFRNTGLRGLEGDPIVYASTEAHHSIHKSIQIFGLGQNSLREIPVTQKLKMDVNELSEQIQKDKKNKKIPTLVIATAGTTNAGSIDPIKDIAAIAAKENIWLHIDAAYGGTAVILPELRPHFLGSELADSITLDPHKWMSISMGIGLFLTKHSQILNQVFKVNTPYISANSNSQTADPYAASMQWSRRFLGLKLFLTLAVSGWDGYRKLISHQLDLLKKATLLLEKNDWKIVNDTPLPVICFVDKTRNDGQSEKFLKAVAEYIVSSGRIWISTTTLSGNQCVLRLGLINFMTDIGEIELAIGLLSEARKAASS